MTFKIGCDPEVFLKKGSLISAHGAIPGTKKEPFKVNKGAVQVDGMALEFNIDPASSYEEFQENIDTVMDALKEMIDGDIEIIPTAHFGLEYIESQPKEAKDLGCEPDFNAWTGEVNPKPDVNMPFRTASGHIHIGWTEGVENVFGEHYNDCLMVVKQLDASLGLLSLTLDGDKDRRKLYGKAGAFRPKSYGVEYRVLSNFWLKDKSLTKLIYDTTIKALEDLSKGVLYFGHNEERIRGVIDNVQ